MQKIASLRAAGEIIKTASAVIRDQDRRIQELEAMIEQGNNDAFAADLAVRMADAGHLDPAQLEEKAAEFASDPSRLPVIQEAINLLDDGSYKLASLSDEQGRGSTSRSQLEAYLLGDL